MSVMVDAQVSGSHAGAMSSAPEEERGSPGEEAGSRPRLRMVTPCTTPDDFAARFARHIDETSIFVRTRRVVRIGLERPFLFQLADGTPVLEGRARVASVPGGHRAGRRRGMVLEFLEMSEASRALHRAMVEARGAAKAAADAKTPGRALTNLMLPSGNVQSPAVPERLARATPAPVFVEPRKPDSPFVLLANLLGQPGDDERGPGVSVASAFDVSDATPPRPVRTHARYMLPAIAAVSLVIGLTGGHGMGGRSERVPVAVAMPVPVAVPVASSTLGCTARIAATARSVEVTWNGQPIGATPLADVAVPCGAGEVVLAHPRYQRAVRQVDARPGETVSIDVAMERPAGVLTLRSRPAGATFTVDGVAVGTAREGVRVRAYSRVEITAELAGRRPWSKRVYVRGTSRSVVAKLAPARRGGSLGDPAGDLAPTPGMIRDR